MPTIFSCQLSSCNIIFPVELLGFGVVCLVLEASVQNFQDERRTLLERCITNEEEIQKLRGHVAGMKCKLDEAQGALQELGRENASLQVWKILILYYCC